MLRRNLQKKKKGKEMVQFHFYKDANHLKAEIDEVAVFQEVPVFRGVVVRIND